MKNFQWIHTHLSLWLVVTLGGGRLVLEQKDLNLLKDFTERLVLFKAHKN